MILICGSCKNSTKKDMSYTAGEYKAKGMPDADSIWSDKDYVKAHVVLGKIKAASFFSMPAKNSEKSGPVFRRMISKENLSFLEDTSQSLGNRAFRIQYFSSFLNELSRMYFDNLKPEQYYREELIEIYIFRLYVQDKMLELGNRIMISDDPSVKGMQEGFTAVRQYYMNLIYVLLNEQIKSEIYRSADLEKLSAQVSASLTKNVTWMSIDSRQKILKQVQNTIEKTTLDPVKKNFTSTLTLYGDPNR